MHILWVIILIIMVYKTFNYYFYGKCLMNVFDTLFYTYIMLNNITLSWVVFNCTIVNRYYLNKKVIGSIIHEHGNYI